MTPALHIDIAMQGDAAGIADMSRDLIEHGLPWTWGPGRVSRAIAAPDTNVAVVRGQGSISGFGIMEYWDADAHLVLLAVRPASHRQGIGSTILRWLELSALAAGARTIRVETRRDNVAARHFYNEHGYHELTIKSRMYSNVLDGIQLEKWLRTTSVGDV
jgi:ribosomal-protein-alanine N-acetyltransferase